VIDLGDPLTLTLTVRDPDTGQLADATSVAAVVTLPDLTTSPALTVTHPSLGEYRAAYTPTVAGLHQVVWTASGANAGTHTESFGVSAAEPALPISLTEARRILGVGVDAARDELIRDDLRAALGHIERYTGQTYRRQVVTETHAWQPCGLPAALILRQSPVQAVSAITDAGTTVAATGYSVDALAGIVTRLGGWGGPVVITYTVGALVVPDDVLDCCREILRILWARRSGATGSPRRTSGVDGPERTIAGALAALNVVMPGWA